jgi:acyl-CoA reductase-like NAD-dependent aldehyde dehydrogenase
MYNISSFGKIMKLITNEQFEKQYKELTSLNKGILSRWNQIEQILINEVGLTKNGADLDKVLFKGHLDALKAEKYHLLGKKLCKGKFAASIAYDVPNFLVMQYAGVPFLAGMRIELHFASIAKNIGKVWQQVIDELKIKTLSVDLEMSGKDFGNYALNDNEIRHLTLSGGSKLIDIYSKCHMDHLDTITVFGPTRPKTLILEDISTTNNDHQLEKVVNDTVMTSMFSSGQLCALDKEMIVVKHNYNYAKKIAIQQVKNIISFSKTTHYVDAIKDLPAFNHAKSMLDYIKNSQDYEILVGGKIIEEQQYICPTLVEAKNGVNPDIDGFWPYLIISKAENDEDAVVKATDDTKHGCYAYVYINDTFKFYNIEKYLLGGHYGTVLKNANILNKSIGQPYGGFKYSFMLRKKLNDNKEIRLTGNHYSANTITKDI